MMALMNLTAVKDISALPGAISRFERDLKLYEQRSGRPFPEEFKVPTFLKLLPRSHERELKLKFAMDDELQRTHCTGHGLLPADQVRGRVCAGRQRPGGHGSQLYGVLAGVDEDG